MWHKNRGFTLIELLLVLAIIGFLVAIIVPSVGNYGAEAKEKAVKSDLQTLKAAIEMYRVEKGVFPTTGALEAELQGVSNRLVDNVPQDPYLTTTQDYTYVLAVAGTAAGSKDTYVVYSVGKSGTGACLPVNTDTCTKTAPSGFPPIYYTNAKAGCTGP
ncbi:MAG: prepilin-type N-terminal cleavage/methylation domain-containing protein [Candidatus Omnitrophota bacterium]